MPYCRLSHRTRGSLKCEGCGSFVRDPGQSGRTLEGFPGGARALEADQPRTSSASCAASTTTTAERAVARNPPPIEPGAGFGMVGAGVTVGVAVGAGRAQLFAVRSHGPDPDGQMPEHAKLLPAAHSPE